MDFNDDNDDDYISIEADIFFKTYDLWRNDRNIQDEIEILAEFDAHLGLKFMDKMDNDGTYMFDLIDREKWFLSKIKYGL
ncbi:MAG: hypothetical protein RL728_83 [Bacteroidota bacterium]|jgi:hypothetical protein